MSQQQPSDPSRKRPSPLSRLVDSYRDRVFFHLEFNILEEHRAFAEKHFMANAQSLEERYQAEVAPIDDEYERQQVWDELFPDFVTAVHDLPRLQWYAQFIVVYSSFEHTLNAFCRVVKTRSRLALSVKDLEGQGIRRAANYLIKLADVVSPFQTHDWHRARLLGDIRNAIVHRGGEVEFDLGNDKSLSYRIQSLPGLRLRQDELEGHLKRGVAEIVLSSEFVRLAIETLLKVLTDIAEYRPHEDES